VGRQAQRWWRPRGQQGFVWAFVRVFVRVVCGVSVCRESHWEWDHGTSAEKDGTQHSTSIQQGHPNRYLSALAAISAILVVALFAHLSSHISYAPADRSSVGDILVWSVQSGHFTEYFLPAPSSAPSEIAVGRDGNLWFADYGSYALGRITPQGTVARFPLPASNHTSNVGPDSIITDAHGNLWFTENDSNWIGRLSP
jgi:hypothetical protein